MTRRWFIRVLCGVAFAALPASSGSAAQGQFCGGIAGVACPQGQRCSMAGCNHPDCGGRCVDGDSVPAPAPPNPNPGPESPALSPECELVAHPPERYRSGRADVDSLSDQQLFDRARAVPPGDKIRGQVGSCWISDYSPQGAGRRGMACDYYVKSSKSDLCGSGCAQTPVEAARRLRVAVGLGYCGGPVQAK